LHQPTTSLARAAIDWFSWIEYSQSIANGVWGQTGFLFATPANLTGHYKENLAPKTQISMTPYLLERTEPGVAPKAKDMVRMKLLDMTVILSRAALHQAAQLLTWPGWHNR
jgi:hypothetical protein